MSSSIPIECKTLSKPGAAKVCVKKLYASNNRIIVIGWLNCPHTIEHIALFESEQKKQFGHVRIFPAQVAVKSIEEFGDLMDEFASRLAIQKFGSLAGTHAVVNHLGFLNAKGNLSFPQVLWRRDTSGNSAVWNPGFGDDSFLDSIFGAEKEDMRTNRGVNQQEQEQKEEQEEEEEEKKEEEKTHKISSEEDAPIVTPPRNLSELRKLVSQHKNILFYYDKNCSHSSDGLHALLNARIVFTKCPMTRDDKTSEYDAAMTTLTGLPSTMPSYFSHGRHIGGGDELVQLYMR